MNDYENEQSSFEIEYQRYSYEAVVLLEEIGITWLELKNVGIGMDYLLTLLDQATELLEVELDNNRVSQ